MTVKEFGYGKVILLGEHAVVYGKAALVGALDIGIEIQARQIEGRDIVLELDDSAERFVVAGSNSDLGQALQIIVDGLPNSPRGVALSLRPSIPLGAGLGSSAAIAVAVIRALSALAGVTLDNAEIAALANKSESIFHRHPSGVDAAAATYGSLLFFRRTEAPKAVVTSAPISLVLALAEPAPSTRKMVDLVRHYIEDSGDVGQSQLSEIDQLVHRATRAIECGDSAGLGRLINSNHGILREMGVSTPRLDVACRAARDAGALGAKLTGAGGGGMVLALAPGREREVSRAFKSVGATFVRSVQVAGTSRRS